VTTRKQIDAAVRLLALLPSSERLMAVGQLLGVTCHDSRVPSISFGFEMSNGRRVQLAAAVDGAADELRPIADRFVKDTLAPGQESLKIVGDGSKATFEEINGRMG
jgi:hypothetical protein